MSIIMSHNIVINFSPLHRAYCLIHIYFTNICTCDSHNVSVNTLIVKTLKLLALQHVSVFHKTIIRELFVPIKVTYCPVLFSKYAGSMSYFICDGLAFHVTRFPCVDLFCPCVTCVVRRMSRTDGRITGACVGEINVNCD